MSDGVLMVGFGVVAVSRLRQRQPYGRPARGAQEFEVMGDDEHAGALFGQKRQRMGDAPHVAAVQAAAVLLNL